MRWSGNRLRIVRRDLSQAGQSVEGRLLDVPVGLTRDDWFPSGAAQSSTVGCASRGACAADVAT